MKKITLPKILDCLENETGEIIMDPETIEKARISVERTVSYTHLTLPTKA